MKENGPFNEPPIFPKLKAKFLRVPLKELDLAARGREAREAMAVLAEKLAGSSDMRTDIVEHHHVARKID